MDENLTLIESVKVLREAFLETEKQILALKTHNDFAGVAKEGSNNGEAIANIMLAYRHAEDARMRLGKVIQAMDGGVSIYDKNKEAGEMNIPEKKQKNP